MNKRSKHNFTDWFLDDYEYNNYFDEEPKTVKEDLNNLPLLKGDEEKYYILNGIKVLVFFGKISKISTCAIVIRIAVTFGNQIFL